ncbi:winged helix-turn-helix domain-containing protein [Salinarimonas soli]|uniref:OmpR/PhoB-type domain-containing protein n=1 Tax=Salinarimonas soli TaxID=1638099 RepID=A0A5B2VCE0_9HYPH|nr:winged helix-turn-helix domain-containing protein [Salinarimonas soli]KAA2236418.1 hypothetical protein F0L46_14850 [Salinarimonas soli]
MALGQRAVALLRLLLDCEGKLVSKEALFNAAWPGLAVEDSNLTVQIAALRRAFGQAGDVGWIETLPRWGYRYVGPPVGRNSSVSKPLPISPPMPNGPSLAVLPFTNMSDDPRQEYFAGGMVDEDIVAGLCRIKWLFVIARSSSALYKGVVEAAGHHLGCQRMQTSLRSLRPAYAENVDERPEKWP